MSFYSRAVQATALCGVLVLAACSSPNSDDMYRGGRKIPQGQEQQASQAQPVLSAQRLAAIKAFGLDHQVRPEKLVGMSAFDVKQTLGLPSFVRKDNGVEIWQYRTQNCILDLFLYEDRQNGLSVDHSELRGPELDSRGQLSCLETIIMGQS
ncbi:exported hypothetical protein [Candidatus Terasakiella magnetica]|uniref:Lipoprotein SmpA/OmlA domain-containing protein n=1 Tax=Candidatus Terasakiella magnetica TaxID=1867952 RepID=A0A1C3RGM2_9PROT|nr:hypothetical protein [Candidatus Terasakiella magnetica]SCA56421.1 exported hypothetical protein [Candidatus Terasakiella magnetica]